MSQLPKAKFVIPLPCKPGTKVYAYCECMGVLEYIVKQFVISEDGVSCECCAYSKPTGDCPSELLDELEFDVLDFHNQVCFDSKDVKIPS